MSLRTHILISALLGFSTLSAHSFSQSTTPTSSSTSSPQANTNSASEAQDFQLLVTYRPKDNAVSYGVGYTPTLGPLFKGLAPRASLMVGGQKVSGIISTVTVGQWVPLMNGTTPVGGLGRVVTGFINSGGKIWEVSGTLSEGGYFTGKAAELSSGSSTNPVGLGGPSGVNDPLGILGTSTLPINSQASPPLPPGSQTVTTTPTSTSTSTTPTTTTQTQITTKITTTAPTPASGTNPATIQTAIGSIPQLADTFTKGGLEFGRIGYQAYANAVFGLTFQGGANGNSTASPGFGLAIDNVFFSGSLHILTGIYIGFNGGQTVPAYLLGVKFTF